MADNHIYNHSLVISFVTVTGTCRRELEITILMDHSGSIRYAKAWADIQAFANKIIDHVTVDRDGGARFSLITFDDFARLEFGLDK